MPEAPSPGMPLRNRGKGRKPGLRGLKARSDLGMVVAKLSGWLEQVPADEWTISDL